MYSDEHLLAHAHEYIERRSFGYNDDNTCSAIALAQALNYLSLEYGRNYVPDEWRSQDLGKSIVRSAGDAGKEYPGTFAFHRFLADDCDLCPVSYGDRITVPFAQYVAEKLGADAGIRLKWTLFPRASTIRANIDRNMPVLITTTLAGKLSWHTMLVYGYRKKASGGMQLLVHTGWYSDVHADAADAGKSCSEGRWIDKKLATYGYYFTLEQ